MPRYTSGTDLPKSGLELQKMLFLVIANFEAEHGSCTGGSQYLIFFHFFIIFTFTFLKNLLLMLQENI